MSRIVEVDQEFIDDFGDPRQGFSPHYDRDHTQYGGDPFPGLHPIGGPMFDELPESGAAAAILEQYDFGDQQRNLCSAMSLACVLHRLEQLQRALARIDEKALRDEAIRLVKQVLFPEDQHRL